LNVSVGLKEGQSAVEVELTSRFTDASGKPYPPGRYRFTSEVTLAPSEPASAAFALDDLTIGIGFHWERKERQLFRGAFRLLRRESGLTVVNEVSLEDYVTSVISSEMSASCPLELLKAHAVISRSWLRFAQTHPSRSGEARVERLTRSCAGTAAKLTAISMYAPMTIARGIRASPRRSPQPLPKRFARPPASFSVTREAFAMPGFRSLAAE
jgi:hypothetical protein